MVFFHMEEIINVVVEFILHDKLPKNRFILSSYKYKWVNINNKMIHNSICLYNL